jgi:hypothetical protein
MKKYILSPILSLTLVLFVLASCDKDNDNPPAKTKTELITNGSWKFESATANGITIPPSTPQIACYVDNVMTFSSNLSGTISEGAVSCSVPAPATFTWAFQSG